MSIELKKMEGREFERGYIKKGPWNVEEDEVLIKHVAKYGPRDWSFIRSKGLLPRTGKSCRLRWVNKLRPNLKTGCKFSLEEERVVIELQAQFGNKWAKIATYLHGRTDNDVKNFWSSRRKRMKRTSQKPTPSPKPQKNKGKAPLNQVKVEEAKVLACGSNKLEENISYPISYVANTKEIEMINLSDLTKPNYQNLKSDPNAVEVVVTPFHTTPLHTVPSFESTSDYNFSQLTESQMGFPLFQECQDIFSEPLNPNFIDIFDEKEKYPECVWSKNNGIGLSTLGQEGNSQSASSNCLFKDFPSEIFEYFEHVPTSSEP